MAKKNLEGLNPGIRAHNSLGRATASTTTTTERPNKRQRLESSPQSTGLMSARPTRQAAKSRPVETGHSSKDIWELDSVTTEGNSGKQSQSQVGQSEYRSSLASVGPANKGRRKRKSRQSRVSVGASSRESPVIEDLTESPTSPDPLAQEPPPSKITSDVAPFRGGAKRARQASLSAPPVKRPKATSTTRESIDDQADELALETHGKLSVKRPSSPSMTSGTERRGRFSADIQPTTFRSPQAESRLGTRKQLESFVITRAASGNSLIQSTSQEQYLLKPSSKDGKIDEFRLVLKSSAPKVADESDCGLDNELAVRMSIKMDTVQQIHHQMTRSKFMIVTRRVTIGGPPKLFIECPSVEECTRLIGLFPSKLCFELDSDRLEKSFTHSWEETMKRQGQLRPTSPGRQQSKLPPGRGRQKMVVELPARRETRTRPKLKDQMTGGDDETEPQRITSDLNGAASGTTIEPRSASPRVRTRRSTATYEPIYLDPLPTVVKWTAENPDWKSKWQKSLTYPATGRSRTTVDACDIPRLDDGECLNDNIINFYLRWLKVKLERENPNVLQKVHLFESYFFERLKTAKYQGVRNWTAKIDLLSYDYIIVPINEHYHWYLAIICNVAKALPSSKAASSDEGNRPDDEGKAPDTNKPEEGCEALDDDSSKITVVQERVKAISIDDIAPRANKANKNNDEDPHDEVPTAPPPATKAKGRKSNGPPVQKYNPYEPRIVTLDSLGSSRSPTCRILREYLIEEALDKKNVELQKAVPGMTAKGIPFQPNGYDCGNFTLAYIERFMADPDGVSRQMLQKEPLDWEIDATRMRSDIRDLLFELQTEQQEREAKDLAVKKETRRRNKSLANGGAQSSPARKASPMSSQEGDRATKSMWKACASSPPSGRASSTATGVDRDDCSSPVVSEKRSGAPERQSAPVQEEEPRPVSPLVESEENTPSKQTNTFYSARTTSTPTKQVNGVPQSPASVKTPSKVTGGLSSLIEEIPSSGSEMGDPSPKKDKHKSTQHEVTGGQPSLVQEVPKSGYEVEDPSPKKDKQKSTQHEVTPANKQELVRPSIEEDGESPIQQPLKTDESKRPKAGAGVLGGLAGRLFSVKEVVWNTSASAKKKQRASYDGIDRS